MVDDDRALADLVGFTLRHEGFQVSLAYDGQSALQKWRDEQALPHAVAQAEHFQAELILLKILEPLAKSHHISLEAAWRVEKATHELARDYLESVATGIRERGILVRVITVAGNPHEGVVTCAEAEQAGMIVICTRGHSGLSRWLIGSVADRVVRGANCVTLVIRGQEGSK
jgi:nucleotide-binding universal stress UspA family protein